ncbi:MAG: DUF167 domain-containing protein [Candidatus Gracilibacteria bacterium]|nr:DUF167 domain-containing protein [Candidatus Gracilibacteria bacterium]
MDLATYVKLDKDTKNYFRIKVSPRQPKTEVFGIMDDGTIKIRLKAVPEKGKANQELVGFIAKELGVSKDSIEIISGAADSIKLLRISN